MEVSHKKHRKDAEEEEFDKTSVCDVINAIVLISFTPGAHITCRSTNCQPYHCRVPTHSLLTGLTLALQG